MTIVQFNEYASQFLEQAKKRSENTQTQYRHAIDLFKDYLSSKEIKDIDPGTLQGWARFMEDEYDAYHNTTIKRIKDGNLKRRPIKSINTINIRLTVINSVFKMAGKRDLEANLIKDETVQKGDKALSDMDYLKFIEFADRVSNEKIKLIIETLSLTGMRISELAYLKVSDLESRTPEVKNKGKRRNVFLPKELTKKLKRYCKENGITDGIIFVSPKTKNEINPKKTRMLSQNYIRDEIKKIAGATRSIPLKKAFPHNFRHLYSARANATPGITAYDISELLGHSIDKNLNQVTAGYVKRTDKDYLKKADAMEANVNQILKKLSKERKATLKRIEKRKRKTKK